MPGFDWWLLILGLVVGGGLVWLLDGDLRRAEDDLEADERALEAERIAEEAIGPAAGISAAAVAEVLDLHRAWLAAGAAPELEALEDERWAAERDAATRDAAGAAPTV